MWVSDFLNQSTLLGFWHNPKLVFSIPELAGNKNLSLFGQVGNREAVAVSFIASVLRNAATALESEFLYSSSSQQGPAEHCETAMAHLPGMGAVFPTMDPVLGMSH